MMEILLSSYSKECREKSSDLDENNGYVGLRTWLEAASQKRW